MVTTATGILNPFLLVKGHTTLHFLSELLEITNQTFPNSKRCKTILKKNYKRLITKTKRMQSKNIQYLKEKKNNTKINTKYVTLLNKKKINQKFDKISIQCCGRNEPNKNWIWKLLNNSLPYRTTPADTTRHELFQVTNSLALWMFQTTWFGLIAWTVAIRVFVTSSLTT